MTSTAGPMAEPDVLAGERSDEDVAVLVEELVDELLAEYPPAKTEVVAFLGAQFDRGLAWVHFPVGEGGLALSPRSQQAVNERLSAASAPNAMWRNPIGYGMVAPTLITWGTAEQKQRLLRPLFTGEEVWCQLFSEPGAGSDFAGLAARGVRDGDEWIVNGQKVWTSLAHVSRWGLLVVRTDPEAVKHAGLTAFVVDMQAPGVDVRPLRQITGDAEFNEVYFTDTRIPSSAMLGNPGDGWRVSLTTLMNERVSIGGAIPPRGSGVIAELMTVWAQLPPEQRDAARRDEVVRLWCRAEVLRLTNIRANTNRKRGDPGPEGSIGKAVAAALNKDVLSYAVTLLGPAGTLYGDYTMQRPRFSSDSDSLQKAFLRSRANSIEGGTSEVMYNILGERVLGLPGDVRVDRDIPWSQVPRN
jgi:alkylation response protein AidB-like acyl-CoA dehydrogenase